MQLPWLDRFRTVRAHRSAFGIALALSQLPSCKTPLDAQPPPPILVADPAPSPLPIPSASASAPIPPAVGVTDTPQSAEFAADGTLVVIGRRVLLTLSREGTVARQALPVEAAIEVSGQLPGVLLQTKEGVRLLATPSLATLYNGKGGRVPETSNAIVLPDEGAVLTAGAGGLVRLVLPKDAADGVKAGNAQVFAVHSVANHSRLNVTVSKDADATGFSSLLYDASGAPLGRGVPLSSFGGYPPQGAWVGTTGFVVEGGRVVRLDLTSGKVQRQSAVTCRKGAFLGNPSPSPNGETLLLTCGEDGVILNATTLAERRRVPRILPGCDNGLFLGGIVLPDNRTFRVEGCGGEARLNLATGRYACSDDPHLVGVPYEMGGGTAPSLPAGRASLPRCGGSAESAGQRLAIGHSGRFYALLGDQLSVVHEGGTIVLEGTGLPAISQDEALLAYVAGQSVIVRSLPGGEVKRTLTLELP